jgi:hypothetical protein
MIRKANQLYGEIVGWWYSLSELKAISLLHHLTMQLKNAGGIF